MIPMDHLVRKVDQHPYRLVFATISGAHLYGFPSADSDFDLRGAHVLPLPEVIGLHSRKETIDNTTMDDGLEIDLVTHDVEKFFGLMLKKNGYVLEQVCSPLIVRSTDGFEQLQSIASKCVTRHHWHHYQGFAATQWKLIQKEESPRVKPLLYLYRVLMTGIYMMRTGSVEANILTLNKEFQLPLIEDLVERKVNGEEKEPLSDYDQPHHEKMYDALLRELRESGEKSTLPEVASCKDELNDLLVTLRMA